MTSRMPRNTSTGMAVPYLAEYLTHLQRQALTARGRPLAESTVQATKTRLRTVLARLPDGIDILTVLADRALTDGLIDRLFADLAQGSVRNVVTNLNAYSRWLKASGHLDVAVLTQSDVPAYRAARAITDTFTDEEVEQILQAAYYTSERVHLFVLTLADTGCRIGEALALRWDGVAADLAPPRYTFLNVKNGDAFRHAVMSKRLADLWGTAPLTSMRHGEPEATSVGGRTRRHWTRNTREYVFPWAYSTALPMLYRLMDDAEVPRRNPHQLRHSAATRWLKQGNDLYSVAITLGHKSTAVTERFYSHVSPLDVAHVVGWEQEQ